MWKHFKKCRNIVCFTEFFCVSRPAGILVKAIAKKTSDIKIKKAGDTREVNAKSIMAVMSLGVKKGNEVIITAEGEDEEDAIAEIQKVLEENL